MTTQPPQTHILIVDDDDAVRETIYEFLNNIIGYKTYTAAGSRQALEILKRRRIDVVITDILMPEINGLELTDRIRQKYDADVIVMTGYTEEYSYEEAISRGASDFVFKPLRFEELLLRIKRVLRERKLSQERALMMEKLKRLATIDSLTGLQNARVFFNQLELEINRAQRYEHPLALMLMDIDHFKQYNDAFGHLEGDKALANFGRVIKSCLRKMDSAYRYGGEEFTVILPETKVDEALIVAERILAAIAKEVYRPEEGKTEHLTASIGVTGYLAPEKAASFVKRADKAMYLSKKNGRNRITSLLPEELRS